jgi:D-threo-aldose 1-dehydrogenase
MDLIHLPGTDLVSSHLGFGSALLHHALRSRDRQALLGAVLDAGFTHFDTARMYGEGMAERELGRFLRGRRQDVTIATKFGIPANWAFERMPPLLYAHRALGRFGRHLLPNHWGQRSRALSAKAAELSLSRSLRALRTDWIDLLLVHEPVVAERRAVLQLAEWLQRQKTSGRVRYVGLAGNANDCVAIADQTDGLFDVLQVEDSLTRQEADAVTQSGRPLQITFGYVRQARMAGEVMTAAEIIRGALVRNPEGLVLVSSRRPERLAELADMASSAELSKFSR